VFLASESRWLFLAWILPHGVPELTAICLCAAAGLALGAAVAAPGRRGVSAALREAAAPATALFLSSIPMFLLAAAIESFVRESALGTPARTAVACAMGGLVISLLAAVRRLARRRQADSSWLEAFSDPRRSAVPGSD
jgi:uncharacterized membrane protein SpoIIM required for sporulation